MNRIYPCHNSMLGRIVPVVLILLSVHISALRQPAYSQPRFRQNDMVTYSDSRNVWSVDIGRREVYIATDGGVWRFDRFNGTPLDPWYTGVGLYEAFPLHNARVVLWHDPTLSLWVATTAMEGLFVLRTELRTWYHIKDILFAGQITSLGDAGDSLLIEIDGSEGVMFSIDPNSNSGRWTTFKSDPPENTRWIGKRNWQPHTYQNLIPSDFSIFFDPDDGTIIDWEQDIFKPVFDLLDEQEYKRYVCYPGLGLVIIDEHRRKFEILQLGPAGSDVRSIGIDDDGSIWMGGENRIKKTGFTCFDRENGTWQRFSKNLIFGMDSEYAWYLTVINNWIYFATDLGLVFCESNRDNWHTVDRFDGLAGQQIRALSSARDILFVGGERGLNRFKLPSGPVWDAGSEDLNELMTGELVSEGDTTWVAGLQGVFRIPPDALKKKSYQAQLIDEETTRTIAIATDRIWIGTNTCIKGFDRTNGTLEEYISIEGFFRGRKPLSLAANDSLLWVGTEGALYRLNRRRNHWIEYDERHGIPHPLIQRMVLEEDTLWICTPKGLTRFIWNRPLRDVF